MFRTAKIITAAIGIAGLMATTAQAETLRSYATDFSSQNKQKNKPTVTARTTTTTKMVRQAAPPPKFIRQQTTTTNTGVKKFGGTGNAVTVKQKTTVTTTTIKNNNFKNTGKFNPNAGTNPTIKQGFVGNNNAGAGAKTFKFANGPGQISKVNFKPAPHIKFVKLGQFAAPVWKSGPKKVWYGNKWKVFVPLTALGVVALGGAYYYPDAYLTTSRNYCEGISENGCRLNWQRVAFEDGEGEWQCVQYCRRPGAAPPPRTVAFVAPPPPAQGAGCEIAIFSEPNFGGTNAGASEEQAHLSDNGWQNQIASVKVKSGTWDFFSDQEFTGETMRLPPGDYADLGPEWTKKAGSFMCAQP
jgi:hypothetical protein